VSRATRPAVGRTSSGCAVLVLQAALFGEILVRWRDGSAAENDPGADSVVVGVFDGHVLHAGVHQRDAAAAVLIISGGRPPASVVAHDDLGLWVPNRSSALGDLGIFVYQASESDPA
jgi:hypothetical protein